MTFIFAERVEEVIAAALTDHKPDEPSVDVSTADTPQPELEPQPAAEVTIAGR
jgi:hypothetical protein